MMAKTKQWYNSKTFWSGIGQIVIGALIEFLPQLQHQLDSGGDVGFGFIAFGLLTIFLRHRTTQPLTFSGQESKPVVPAAPAAAPPSPRVWDGDPQP